MRLSDSKQKAAEVSALSARRIFIKSPTYLLLVQKDEYTALSSILADSFAEPPSTLEIFINTAKIS